METPRPVKKRGLSSENARIVRQRGHNDAQEFAFAIGMKDSYRNDLTAKKDVVDPSGDTHSVKSGEKKWQIFLYGLNRFEKDEAFAVMDGIGNLLADCIKVFPKTFSEYQKNKVDAKENLRGHMVALAEKLQNKTRLRALLNKAMFNGGEINYLSVKDKGVFHVFSREDILKVLCSNLEVCNSKSLSSVSVSEQKVLFRYEGKNLGELEMRNDSEVHYRQIRFNMLKPRVMALLFSKIPLKKKYSKLVNVYGSAEKRFGRWKK